MKQMFNYLAVLQWEKEEHDHQKKIVEIIQHYLNLLEIIFGQQKICSFKNISTIMNIHYGNDIG